MTALRRLALIAVFFSLGAACAPVVSPAPPGVERVVFVGDSLVSRSERDHNLLARVRRALERSHPGVALDLVNAGENGDRIANIRARLAADVVALRPAAVVLYWDSDAADAEDAEEQPERKLALRLAYERDLDAVLTVLRDTTSHVLVSGPTLLGERPRGANPKDLVLDAYTEINRRLCHAHHVAWLDTRSAAFHWLHANAQRSDRDSGGLTEDGEHLNQAGAQLVATEIATALGHWLTQRAGASSPVLGSLPD